MKQVGRARLLLNGQRIKHNLVKKTIPVQLQQLDKTAFRILEQVTFQVSGGTVEFDATEISVGRCQHVRLTLSSKQYADDGKTINLQRGLIEFGEGDLKSYTTFGF